LKICLDMKQLFLKQEQACILMQLPNQTIQFKHITLETKLKVVWTVDIISPPSTSSGIRSSAAQTVQKGSKLIKLSHWLDGYISTGTCSFS
jgi:hypothetical protein